MIKYSVKNLLGRFVLYYLRFFARIELAIHKPRIIGVTGSVGKTSAVNAIYATLKDYFPTQMVSEKNSESGIPLGILGVEPLNYTILDWLRMLALAPFGLLHLRGATFLVVEMGVDEPKPPKNMEYLLTIVKPEISVLLNVHPVHVEQFGSVEKIAKEKVKIVTENDKCRIAIINSDQIKSQKSKVKITNQNLKVLTFGEEKTNDISFGEYKVGLGGTKFGFSNGLSVYLRDYVLPQEYFETFATAILVGQSLGLNNKQIASGLTKNFRLPPGRASIFAGVRNTTIIDSSYNASTAPTIAFLDLAYRLKRETKRPLVFIFGDMRELGEETKIEHEKVAAKIVEGVDYLYCVGPLTKKFIVEKSNVKGQMSKVKDIKWFENSIEVGEYLKENLPKDAIVLVKGSQNTIFLEEAVKYILADKKNIKLLCRQEKYWLKLKGVL